MPDTKKFDMPDHSRSFEERGGWLVGALMPEFQWTDVQAAGFVGNPGYESGGFRLLQEIRPLVSGSRGGYGWSQWTGPRRVAFETWCLQRALAPSSDEANYGFMVAELHKSFQGMISTLRRVTTLRDATFTVGRLYERPYGTTATYLPGLADRLKYAQRALNGYHAGGAAPASSTPAKPATAPPVQPAATKPSARASAPAAESDGEDEAAALNKAELDRITRGG